MRLFSDVDDVMCDLLGSVIKWIEELTGEKYERKVFDNEDFFDGINRPDLKLAWKQLIKSGGYVRSLKPMPGAKPAITYLQKRTDFHVLTAPMKIENWQFERMMWLEEKMGIPVDNHISTKAKHVCSGEIFIDDRISNLQKFREHNPYTLLMLFDQPWNTYVPDEELSSLFQHGQRSEDPLGKGFVRVKSWDEIVKIVDDLNSD